MWGPDKSSDANLQTAIFEGSWVRPLSSARPGLSVYNFEQEIALDGQLTSFPNPGLGRRFQIGLTPRN
jgi:hypothetical protein